MKNIHSNFQVVFSAIALFALVIGTSSCKDKSSPSTIALGSELCLATLHHEQGLPDVTVYIKYNQIEFPGYDDLSIYDDSVISDEFAEACFEKVPPGKHWCVGVGYDNFHDEPIRGSVFYEISRNGTSRFPHPTSYLSKVTSPFNIRSRSSTT